MKEDDYEKKNRLSERLIDALLNTCLTATVAMAIYAVVYSIMKLVVGYMISLTYEELLLSKRGLKPYQFKLIDSAKLDELLQRYQEYRMLEDEKMNRNRSIQGFKKSV